MKKFLTVLFILTALFTLFTLAGFATEPGEAVQQTQNPFETAYTELAKHSDKILSGLAFCGSLILAFSYKKGLLPMIKSALSALSASVAKLKDETERSGKISEERAAASIEGLTRAENMLSELCEKLEALESEAALSQAKYAKLEELGAVMKYQIELLYDVFMSSSLPLYQKEAIGEKISAMKRILGEAEKETQNAENES